MSENDDLLTFHNLLAENTRLKSENKKLNQAYENAEKVATERLWEIRERRAENVQLKAENERLKKEIEHWNVLEAERAEWLRKTIGSAGLEHFVREWMDLKDECDRYKAALEKIADYPPWHWRFDCKDFADCIDISREALELEGTSHD